MLVEGESLLNDGTAIVVFNVLLAFALSLNTGGEQPAALPDLLVGAVIDFVRVAAGGALIGLGLGWLTAQVIARLDDYLIETTLTTVLAFGAYLVAERLHLSGVLAMVATIVLMILLDVVHPPAVSTALSFAFRAGDERSLVLFTMAVGMISVLVVLEQVMLWLLSRRVRSLSQSSGAEERRDDGRATE